MQQKKKHYPVFLGRVKLKLLYPQLFGWKLSSNPLTNLKLPVSKFRLERNPSIYPDISVFRQTKLQVLRLYPGQDKHKLTIKNPNRYLYRYLELYSRFWASCRIPRILISSVFEPLDIKILDWTAVMNTTSVSEHPDGWKRVLTVTSRIACQLVHFNWFTKSSIRYKNTNVLDDKQLAHTAWNSNNMQEFDSRN